MAVISLITASVLNQLGSYSRFVMLGPLPSRVDSQLYANLYKKRIPVVFHCTPYRALIICPFPHHECIDLQIVFFLGKNMNCNRGSA